MFTGKIKFQIEKFFENVEATMSIHIREMYIKRSIKKKKES